MKKALGFMALGAIAAGIGMAIRDLVVEGVFDNLPDCEDCDCCCCSDTCDDCCCSDTCDDCPCCGCEMDCDECCGDCGDCDGCVSDMSEEDDGTMNKLSHAAEKADEQSEE